MEITGRLTPEIIEQMNQWCDLRVEAEDSGLWASAAILDHLQSRSFVAGLTDDQLLAIILFQDVGEAFEILYLESHPHFRRQGQMAELFQGWVHENPNRKVWLEVHSNNQKALNFYGKLGFQRSGERPKYYADGGDAILFTYPR